MLKAVLRKRRPGNALSVVQPAPSPISICLRDGSSSRTRSGGYFFRIYSVTPNLTNWGHCCSWIYRLFLAIDGNFRLKRRKVSSDKRDPGLGHGWAFFVEESAFKEHLKANWNHKQDVRNRFMNPAQ